MPHVQRSLFLDSLPKGDYLRFYNPSIIASDGKYILAIRADYKSDIPGIDHDLSDILGGVMTAGSLQLNQKVDGNLQLFDDPLVKKTEEFKGACFEDPRIARIGNQFYLLYTLFDGKNNAQLAYSSGSSIENLSEPRIISPNEITVEEARELTRSQRYRDEWQKQIGTYGPDSILWDKDGVLFPEKFNGQYAMLHRFKPDIQIVYFDSFEQLQNDDLWRLYIANIEDHVFMTQMFEWESRKIGAGATPIKLPQEHVIEGYNWLLLYHGVEEKGDNLIYSAGAALLSHDLKTTIRLEEPLFRPELEFEKNGFKNEVVFVEGAVIKRDPKTGLYIANILYGGADCSIGLAQISLEDLVNKAHNEGIKVSAGSY